MGKLGVCHPVAACRSACQSMPRFGTVGDTMTATEMVVYEMDTMLADGASWAEYESFLDDLIGSIEDSTEMEH